MTNQSRRPGRGPVFLILGLLSGAGIWGVALAADSSDDASIQAAGDSGDASLSTPGEAETIDRVTLADLVAADLEAIGRPPQLVDDSTPGLVTITSNGEVLTGIFANDTLVGYVPRAAIDEPDPAASIRNCEEAAAELANRLCADLYEALDAGRTWVVPLDADGTFFGLPISAPLADGGEATTGYLTEVGVLPAAAVSDEFIDALKKCRSEASLVCADLVRDAQNTYIG